MLYVSQRRESLCCVSTVSVVYSFTQERKGFILQLKK
jgi:hypothetical protein